MALRLTMLTLVFILSLSFSEAYWTRPRFDRYWHYCDRRRTLVCNFRPTEGNTARGRATFQYAWVRGRCLVQVKGKFSELTPNTQQGWHIHKYGDIDSENGSAAGGHFSAPRGRERPHGLPNDSKRHWGDLGNLRVNAEGEASVSQFDSVITLNGILGRGMIIHALRDQGSSQQPSGASGTRVAQCVIGIAKPEKM